ncbi:HAD-IA family hydrolase [Lactococcus taiwanensis]|jgi:HAD superfamily hydrolase (TIGR01549 family)|uniref:HAD-IA family hydrolase n=1 Tax=Lactococcus taiwanensis TaxID=1151742 RepID=UPI00289D0ED7|nr:HAD-IA family hydrolase [Lactococcus taiwanensis]
MVTFIWDLDGTLIDSYGVFIKALETTFEKHDLPFEREEIYRFIKERSVNELLKAQPVDEGLLKDEFNQACVMLNKEVKLMPGAREVLEWAQGRHIRNFIYTHKGQNAYVLLEALDILNYFTEVITSQNGFERKPHPAGIHYLLNKYALDSKATYYIGDRKLDVEVAMNSGIQSINFLEAKTSQKIDKLTDIIPLFEEKNFKIGED